MLLYVAKWPTSVLQQPNNCNTMESYHKWVQFVTLFHLLTSNKPMREFPCKFGLYTFLHHLIYLTWLDWWGWLDNSRTYVLHCLWQDDKDDKEYKIHLSGYRWDLCDRQLEWHCDPLLPYASLDKNPSHDTDLKAESKWCDNHQFDLGH